MFKLSDLLKYDEAVIQCHDNPDPDSISAAFGIYAYLERNNKKSKIVYSGIEKIKKSNIKMMLDWLSIEIEHVKDPEDFPRPALLICADCQYGEGNVTKIEADAIAIIDHHLMVVEEKDFDMGAIQSQLGSCATLVWDLLRGEDFDFALNKDVPAALYYGLMTDTNNFSEISHPLDKDMRDELQKYCDRGIVRKLSLCNITLEELEIAGVALLRNYNSFDKKYALFKTELCDPNVLGFISDIALQVDSIDLCVVYSVRESTTKISVRSCSREIMASEYVEFLTAGVGSGGGHREKAGGSIQKAEIDDLGKTIAEYMIEKTEEYFASYDMVYAPDHGRDVSNLKKYTKLPIPRGYVETTAVFEEDAPVMIRTVEGDSNIRASSDIYLMIGIKGEVHPIKKEKFQMYYRKCDPVKVNFVYEPTAKNEITGEVKKLIPYMNFCFPEGETDILAEKLTRHTKVFTEWNPNGYMYGKPGDFIAFKCDDTSDVYIIQGDIFALTYEEAKS